MSKRKRTITVSGVRFSADQIKSAVVHIDGRDIQINEQTDKKRTAGFHQQERDEY